MPALPCQAVVYWEYAALRLCQKSIHILLAFLFIMLTRSLQELEAHGLVSRIQYSEIPPHVEYCLTKSGQKLVPALHELKKWGEEQAILERQLHSTSNNKE